MVPTVRVVITFTKFVELQADNEDEFHTPPSSPTKGDNGGGGLFSLGSRHKESSSSGSGAEEEDPFVIPRGYKWIRFHHHKKPRKVEINVHSSKKKK